MATLDIRNTNKEITEIRFSDEESLYDSSCSTISIIQKLKYDGTRSVVHVIKSDIPNLINALNKAKELGWY